VGLVFIISPWNYPLLTTINTLIAAVLAGNTVVIKHSPYTPYCGKLFEEAFEHAGLKNIVNDCLVDLEDCQQLLADPLVSYVSFTGSVASGKFVYEKVVSSRTTDFIDVGLELGGKDAIYVAEDYDIKQAAEALMDGAMYNAGQSCCAVERIFVHKNVYDDFLQHSGKFLSNYKLDDPLLEDTTMGPLTLPQAPELLKQQIEDAVAQGGKLMIGGLPTTCGKGKGRFFDPSLVAGVENDMNMMVDESFGPIIGVNPVENDEEALKLINETKFGLTAGIYTKDKERAMKFVGKCNAGTVFMNRCDSLSPFLPWSGRKLSGKGVSLSRYGFHAVTRTKGYNFNLKK
jgi:acyl-CoA reductase-like NAD-dependent aldehyde dehydrogenase